jgi:predicted nucleotide-binding protein
MPRQSVSKQEEVKRSKVSQAEFPNNSLESALKIARALWDNFAGKGAAPHDIAMSLDLSPTSGSWRNLCGSSIAYGLTEGGYNAQQIILTDLGRRIVAPTEDGDDLVAKAQALMQPRVQREFFEKYDRAKFPKDDIGRNVLVSLGLPKDRSERAFEILKENGTAAKIIRETKTGPFVALGSTNTAQVVRPAGDAVEMEDDEGADASPASTSQSTPPAATAAPSPPSKKQLFVAHGKNTKPLDDLKKILNEFKIPYKVAVDEPNKGRPISAKVAQLMNECSAGIFIFTKDEKFLRDGKSGHEEVWRPSENVVYELGAANKLWGQKIIIVREEGVNFPSDFSDLGYITFKDGEIASKAMEIFKELIALELVMVTAA